LADVRAVDGSQHHAGVIPVCSRLLGNHLDDANAPLAVAFVSSQKTERPDMPWKAANQVLIKSLDEPAIDIVGPKLRDLVVHLSRVIRVFERVHPCFPNQVVVIRPESVSDTHRILRVCALRVLRDPGFAELQRPPDTVIELPGNGRTRLHLLATDKRI